MPIQRGVKVAWTGSGGGVREYAGEVVALVPPGVSPYRFLDITTAEFAEAVRTMATAKLPRYLIRCPDSRDTKVTRLARLVGRPRTMLRCALASIIDKQNPDAAREGA